MALFRLLIGTCAVAVAVAAVLLATAEPCVQFIAVTQDVRTALLFDRCVGAVIVQPLPNLTLTPA